MASLYAAGVVGVNVPGRIQRSARPSEEFVSLGQELRPRFERGRARRQDLYPLEALQTVTQHGAIGLAKDVEAYLDAQLRRDSQDVAIEGGVMQLAQRKAVGDDRFASGMAIGQDVRRLQQLLVTEPADRALRPIRLQHPLPKALLVDATLREPRDGRASRFDA